MKFALVLSFTVVLFAQNSPIIQTETREVLVDAIVTAKNGAYIGDLTAKDFHITQDGKEQLIRGFSVETPSASTQTRSLVLFFDEISMEARDQAAVRQAAASFIDAEAGPNHRLAILTFNGTMRIAQNFTDNPGRLKDALNQASFHGLAPGAADSDRSHDPSRVEEDRIVGHTNPSAMATSFAARDMVRVLGDLARSLGVLPGRKIVVVFSGSVPSTADPKAAMRDAVEAANKSGVAFYPIDVRPVFTQTDPGVVQQTPATHDARSPGAFGRGAGGLGDPGLADSPVPDTGAGGQQILSELASATGGFVVRNTNNLLGGLQNIGKEQDQYYVLTYAAPDAKEGSCHQIRVKVDRKQTAIRSRKTYCMEKPLDLLAGTSAGKDLEKRAAETQHGDIAASIELPYFYVAPNIARVDVAMEIQPGALKFENKKGKLHAELNFLGLATGADGEVHARFSDAMKLDFDSPAQLEGLKGRVLHYEKEFKIAPGQYTLTIAFNQGEASFGKIQAPLVVAPWTGGFALSAPALSKEAHPAADLGLAPSLDSRTPLVAEGAQVVPSGSREFAKSDLGFVYFEVYGPEAASAKVHVRVLERRKDGKTGEQRWDGGISSLSAQGSNGKFIPAATRLPIDLLGPGSYQLEIAAEDVAQKEVKRTADFEIR
ncbi:MAG TPA: VWA domain-containing protein [Bryobacteraceae bacterium]|nr:VWA domain-containing protein [Bryobacteraceae bacterium]